MSLKKGGEWGYVGGKRISKTRELMPLRNVNEPCYTAQSECNNISTHLDSMSLARGRVGSNECISTTH